MTLSLPQQTIVQAPQRFRVVIAGRRFGKTHLSIRELCRHARHPHSEVWYVAPTYKQAKMIVFKKLRRRLQDLRWVKKINETNLSFELKNGSTISLKGADNYDSLRGVGLDFLVIDEFADIDPEAWYETLRPTLSDTQGHALFIGTPKGMNWAHDLYTMSEEYPLEWASFQYTTIEGGQVTAEEVEAARRSLDIRTFRQEFEASFETFSGRVFYAFDRRNNVRAYTAPLPSELHIGIDFNVDPMSAVVAVRTNMGLHVIDEIRIYGSNTDELVDEIKTRYTASRITCYPDPAGAARKTSAGNRSDHTILRAAGFQIKAPSSHNPIRDGVNAVNAKLLNSHGETHLYIDPKCKYVIECLEKQTYKTGTSQVDKTHGFDHMNDALRYMVDYLFPIRQPTEPQTIRRWGHQLAN
jgi:Terminase large subunit, T4likevirus-type, N-terminal/Terminase RNaseH-like domain